MKQRVEKAAKLALSIGIVIFLYLCILIAQYRIACWIDAFIWDMFELAMQVCGCVALGILLFILKFNVPLEGPQTETDPEEVAKSCFWAILICDTIFTAAACGKGFLNISFFRTIGAMLFASVIYAFVIWLVETALKCRKEDQESNTSDEGT